MVALELSSTLKHWGKVVTRIKIMENISNSTFIYSHPPLSRHCAGPRKNVEIAGDDCIFINMDVEC